MHATKRFGKSYVRKAFTILFDIYVDINLDFIGVFHTVSHGMMAENYNGMVLNELHLTGLKAT